MNAMTIQLRAIGIVTASIPASLDFYRLLGAEPAGGSDGPHAEVELNTGMKLMWDTEEMVRSMDPDWVRPTGGVAIGLAFECGTAAGVDDTYRAIIAAGHPGKAEPRDAPWGQRYAVVIDPDGNPVDLYAAL